ncbi:MAG TPA: sigma-E factor negative regulatory protein [Burkholderiaceae bacterium]|jgi:negative regulator of sigma E activity|nr:sigma-E factor negative regulatory protein [Burkholderiaceae bacterium]
MNVEGTMKQTVRNHVSASLTIERISVLLDGEMDRSEASAAIAALCADSALRRHWHELHRAGDALRSGEVAACDAEGFCARVAAAIASEPTVLAPRAARASLGRRLWMPGLAVAASVAAVAFIAVPLMRVPDTASVANNLAPASISTIDVAGQKQLPTITNARGLSPSFNPYLAAHRELISPSVVPRATVYLRSAEDR